MKRTRKSVRMRYISEKVSASVCR